MDYHMGGSIVMGVPQARWLVNISEGKSIYKWMRTGGTPISRSILHGYFNPLVFWY